MGMFKISGSGLYLGSQTSQRHLAKFIVPSGYVKIAIENGHL